MKILSRLKQFLFGAPAPAPTPPKKRSKGNKPKLVLTNACSIRGADMGRRNIISAAYAGEKLYLERIPFIDDCYDKGGAYWGLPENLWCAWCGVDGDGYAPPVTPYLRIYVRGDDRATARAAVLEVCPTARFYR